MYSVQQDRKARATKLLAAFVSQTEQIASSVLRDKITFRITEQDQFKLYQLQIWAWRYKVPVAYVVRTLLVYWQARMPRHFKRKKGALGLRISTLVGVKSKNYLLQRLQEEFPNNENEAEWRVQNIMSLVPSAGDRDIAVVSPNQFMKEYIARVHQSRERITKAKAKFKRRAFRDNPFLD